MARGALDLAGNRYRGIRLGIDLLKPPALFPNMTRQERAPGVDARRALRDRGLFLSADLALREFDNNGFVDAARRGPRADDRRGRCAFRCGSQARAITGIGDVAGAILANPRIEGWLTVTPKLLRGDGLS